MAQQGGRVPFDPTGALAGPARVLRAPLSADVPDDLWDIVPAVNDDGEYPAEGDWVDFGLAADAPSYTHSRDTTSLEYQQAQGGLFEKLSSVSRSITVQVAEITPENLAVVENSTQDIDDVAADTNKSALKILPFGLYSSLQAYRIAFVSYRPDGSTVVEEPDGTIRPAAVGLVLPRVVLGAEDSEFGFGAGDPTNAPITFGVIPEPTLSGGAEHGFWVFEEEGTISDAP